MSGLATRGIANDNEELQCRTWEGFEPPRRQGRKGKRISYFFKLGALGVLAVQSLFQKLSRV
jgi:hypothetical protein